MPKSESDTALDSVQEDVREAKCILDLTLVPFEPITAGSGQNTDEKEARLRNAILGEISPQELGKIKKQLAGKLVSLSVLFFLWKGKPDVSNTRPVKDLDNLLKILFEVLRAGGQGAGLIQEDSYICEIYSMKEIVDEEEEEGLRLVIEEHKDPKMLRSLKEFYSSTET